MTLPERADLGGSDRERLYRTCGPRQPIGWVPGHPGLAGRGSGRHRPAPARRGRGRDVPELDGLDGRFDHEGLQHRIFPVYGQPGGILVDGHEFDRGQPLHPAPGIESRDPRQELQRREVGGTDGRSRRPDDDGRLAARRLCDGPHGRQRRLHLQPGHDDLGGLVHGAVHDGDEQDHRGLAQDARLRRQRPERVPPVVDPEGKCHGTVRLEPLRRVSIDAREPAFNRASRRGAAGGGRSAGARLQQRARHRVRELQTVPVRRQRRLRLRLHRGRHLDT
jgi:hypothetical protein